jgi:Glycosyl hydrolase family 1
VVSSDHDRTDDVVTPWFDETVRIEHTKDVAWTKNDFVWSIGEEGSDPMVLKAGVPFRHDQFAQSGHDQHRDRDLSDIKTLGATHVRYGVPWRLTEREPRHYDWSRWDQALASCERAGLVPMVDFVHFGLPDHCGAGGFGSTDWLEPFNRYTDAFLDRYGNAITMFTPVNEPGITALASGRYGIWNERGTTTQSWMAALGHVVLANLEAISRMRAVGDGWWIGSEGIDVTPEHGAQGDLVWDLHFGVAPHEWAARFLDMLTDDVRGRIEALSLNGSTTDRTRDRVVAGHDVYPVSLGAPAQSNIAVLLDRYRMEARRFHARYEVPIWIAETSNLGLPATDGPPWMEALHAALMELRADGVPMLGLCWYSRGDQFDWQTMLAEPTGAVTEVGLYDVDRQPRPVAETFRRLAQLRLGQSGE